MTIYAPRPIISQTEKELLVLLAKLVLEENRQSYDGNVGSDCVVVSDLKALELCNLLTEYVGSHSFMRGATFAEMVADGRLADDTKAREIYLKARKDRGRTRVLASRQWADFRARLGLRVSAYESHVRPMDSLHFVEMEARLVRALDVHPALARLIEDLVVRRTDLFERFEKRDQILKQGQIRRDVLKLLSRLRSSSGGIDISKTQMVGMATIVADTTVMFSTRDWGVAGTLSTIAGGLAMSGPEPKS